MNRKKARTVFAVVFGISVAGWAVFGLFFLPDDSSGLEPPSAAAADPNSLWHFPLFLIGILAPVVSALGLLATSLCSIRDAYQDNEILDWEIEWTRERK